MAHPTSKDHADWQAARIANHEDPNDNAAWARHATTVWGHANIDTTDTSDQGAGTTGAAPATTTGGATYQTRTGARTLGDMLQGLDRAAGGHWPGNRTDINAVGAAYDQAGAGGTTTSGGSSAGRSLDDMLQGLDKAAGGHWNGNRTDINAVRQAYDNASNPNAGATANDPAGITALINAITDTNREKLDSELAKSQAQIDQIRQQIVLSKNADDRAQKTLELETEQQRFNQLHTQRQEYISLSTELLNKAVELSSHPADYYKFNQYTSGGKGIEQQLFGDQPRPDFSAPTGPIEPGNITDIMTRLGITLPPGATPPSQPPPAGAPPPSNGAPAPSVVEKAQEPRTTFEGGTPPPGSPGTDTSLAPAPIPNVGIRHDPNVVYSNIKDRYKELVKANGGRDLAGNDPHLLNLYTSGTGIGNDQAAQIIAANRDYYLKNKAPRPDAEVAAHLGSLMGAGTQVGAPA